jgi:hypothetical protein
MRTLKCVSTGVALFAAMFGRNASASLEMVFGAPPTLPEDSADMYEYTSHMRSRMAKSHVYVSKNIRSAVDRQRQAYYKDRKTYQPTQPVFFWTPRLRPGQSRKFALYWTGPWQIRRQLNELMYEITPHHSWARQGSEAASIDRLKPFYAMYVDALEHHCPPDPKADLKMLGDEFAEFIDSDLDEEIDAGPPAQQQCPAGAPQIPQGAVAAAADPPPFGQLEHAAHPVPPAVFNNEDAAHVPQMRLGQRPAGRGQRQRRFDAEMANGQYWDLGQPLPPAPQVPANRRECAAAREACDKDQEDIMDDPGPANLEAMMALDLSEKVPAGQVDPSKQISSTSNPNDDWEVLEWPPWVHFAGVKAQAAADEFLVDPWRYFIEKYNADNETQPVHCPTGQELAKYLAGREKDHERSQSNPLRRRCDLEWCRQREDLDQQAIYEVLRTGLSMERGRGWGSVHGLPGRRN